MKIGIVGTGGNPCAEAALIEFKKRKDIEIISVNSETDIIDEKLDAVINLTEQVPVVNDFSLRPMPEPSAYIPSEKKGWKRNYKYHK